MASVNDYLGPFAQVFAGDVPGSGALIKLPGKRRDGMFINTENPEQHLTQYNLEVPSGDQALRITLNFVIDSVMAQNIVWGRPIGNTNLNTPSTGNHFAILLVAINPLLPECFYIPECYPLKKYAMNREKLTQQRMPVEIRMTDPNSYNTLIYQGTLAALVDIMGGRSPF
jgi:hypothetical protein